MEIKLIKPDEMPKVIELHKEIFKEDNKLFFENLIAKPYYKTFVLTHENKFVAYCIISVIDRQAEIINIGTQQNYRGKGFAKQLLAYVMNNLTFDKMFLEVSTNNVAAIRLYKSVGFQEISRRKNYYGDSDAIIMEKQKT